jgi:hypothetical protein
MAVMAVGGDAASSVTRRRATLSGHGSHWHRARASGPWAAGCSEGIQAATVAVTVAATATARVSRRVSTHSAGTWPRQADRTVADRRGPRAGRCGPGPGQ